MKILTIFTNLQDIIQIPVRLLLLCSDFKVQSWLDRYLRPLYIEQIIIKLHWGCPS